MIPPFLGTLWSIWAWFTSTKVGRWILIIGLAVLAFIGALWRARLAGKAAARREYRRQEQEDYRNAHERMDQADVGNGDADADREWLRDRANRRGR